MLPDLFRRLRPLYGAEIDKLWLEHQIADQQRRKEIEELLTILAVKKLGIGLGEEKIVLEPPLPAVIGAGEYTLGQVSYPGLAPYPFRVGRNELLRHVFLLGPTGTGKSTFILGLLQQLLNDERPFMAFDFKRNYRCLLHSLSNIYEPTPRQRVVVFTVGRDVAPLVLNAMEPPAGVPFPEWAEALADIISTAYLLLQGARNVLKEALLQAHDLFGDDATLSRAHELLSVELEKAKAGSRRYGWLESSARSLDELSKGGFGKALNGGGGATVRHLLDMPVVFELQGLGDDQKEFFCLFLLQAVLLIRKNEAGQREVFQHALVFDESHNVFPKDQYGELGIASRLAREVREYGESIIAATQQSDVSESLIANAGFKIILRCDYPKDVQFASRLLQIEEKWLPKLQLGTGIARLPVRYFSPFLFTFPTQSIKNHNVTDDEVAERWRSSTIGAFTLAMPILERALGARRPPAAVVPRTPAPAREPIDVTEKEHALLADIVAHPISLITHRYERLAWHSRLGNEVKDAVVSKGLAVFEPVATPTAQVKILRLTSAGRKYLARQGVVLPAERQGGVTHEYWRHVIADRLKRLGYRVTTEHPVGNGKTVDLHATKDGHEVVVEVETGRSDIPANIHKCTGLPGTVVFFFTARELADEYRPLLDQLGIRHVTPWDLDQFTAPA